MLRIARRASRWLLWRTATLSSRLVSSRREAGIVKCSVLRRLISLVSVDFKHCASYGLAFVNFLNFDRPEQLRICFPQDVHPRISAPCNARCCSCAVQAHTLPWQSVDGISSTNDQYATPQTRRPLRFKAALSTTKCGIENGMWNAVLRLPEFCHHTLGSVLQNGLASWRSTCAVLHVAVESGSTLVHGSASVSDRLWTIFYVER